MKSPTKERKASYASLTVQVVRESAEPIPVAEIMHRVHRLRPIETRSPEATIRSAIGGCYLIANTGEGKYWWYPRLLAGSRVRVPLVASDLAQKRILFSSDARELLWPSFFSIQTFTDREPIKIELTSGGRAELPLDFFGNGIWGTTGSQEFWNWIQASQASGDDALIIEAIDAEARHYQVNLEFRVTRDDPTLRRRTEEIEQAARERLWQRRAQGMAEWEMVKYLLLAGYYRHPVPPMPITPIWHRVISQLADTEAASVQPLRKKRKARTVYALKIRLAEIDPPVWRRVLVADTTTLGELHWIIQLSMGWTNSHLHQFEIDGTYYSDPDFELSEALEDIRNEHRMTIGKAILGEVDRFIYEYDFGDSWRHEVRVEEEYPLNEGDVYPQCVAGERACPPEDCGGVWGYTNFLKVIFDPSHPEHEETLVWAGGSFEPDRFDLEAVNWKLKKLSEDW